MKKEYTLKQALNYEHRSRLPKEYSGRGTWTWIRSICLVLKVDGTESYAIMEYNGVETSVVKDFGTSARIARIIALYPTEWLRPEEIPKFRSNEEIMRFLRLTGHSPSETSALLDTSGKTGEQIHQDRQTINVLVFQTAIYIQRGKNKERIKYLERKNYRRRYRK